MDDIALRQLKSLSSICPKVFLPTFIICILQLYTYVHVKYK